MIKSITGFYRAAGELLGLGIIVRGPVEQAGNQLKLLFYCEIVVD